MHAHARMQQVRYSEESRTRCIGLTIETRPDYCMTPHLTDMLSYGCTRIEMGVQVRCLMGWCTALLGARASRWACRCA